MFDSVQRQPRLSVTIFSVTDDIACNIVGINMPKISSGLTIYNEIMRHGVNDIPLRVNKR